jgi:hypothetical protein
MKESTLQVSLAEDNYPHWPIQFTTTCCGSLMNNHYQILSTENRENRVQVLSCTLKKRE